MDAKYDTANNALMEQTRWLWPEVRVDQIIQQEIDREVGHLQKICEDNRSSVEQLVAGIPWNWLPVSRQEDKNGWKTVKQKGHWKDMRMYFPSISTPPSLLFLH